MIGLELRDAGHEADHQQAPIPCHAPPDLLEGLTPDRVIGHVHSPTVGQLPDPLNQVVHLPVVDHSVGSQRLTGGHLLGSASHGYDTRSGCTTQLDGRRTHATGSTRHQKGLARSKVCPVVEGEPGCSVVHGHRHRLRGRKRVGQREHRALRQDDPFRQAPTQGDHPLADQGLVNAVTNRRHPAGRLATRTVRKRWLHLVFAPALQHIGEGQTDRFDLDQHPSGFQFRLGHLIESQLVDRVTKFVDSPCAHGADGIGGGPSSQQRVSWSGRLERWLNPATWLAAIPGRRRCSAGGPRPPQRR